MISPQSKESLILASFDLQQLAAGTWSGYRRDAPETIKIQATRGLAGLDAYLLQRDELWKRWSLQSIHSRSRELPGTNSEIKENRRSSLL